MSIRLQTDEVFSKLLHCRHSGRATHQNYPIDVYRIKIRVGQGLFGRADHFLPQVLRQLFKFYPGQGDAHIFVIEFVTIDKRHSNIGGRPSGQFDLSLFRRLLQHLPGYGILLQIDATFLWELTSQIVHYTLVIIIPAQPGIPADRLDVKDAFA